MKIRTGFVSNSSSSSFCIYGKKLSCKDIIELAKKYEIKVDHLNEEDDDLYQFVNVATDIASKTKLSCHQGYYDNPGAIAYIGIEYSSLKKYETTKEFFKVAEDVLGPDCRYIEQTIDN